MADPAILRRTVVLPLCFISAFQKTTLIGVKTLCCKKTTHKPRLQSSPKYNSIMKRRLRLLLNSVNAAVG